MDEIYTLIDYQGELELRVRQRDIKDPQRFYLSRKGTGLIKTIQALMYKGHSAPDFKLAFFLVLLVNNELRTLGKRMATTTTTNIRNSSQPCSTLFYKKLLNSKDCPEFSPKQDEEMFITKRLNEALEQVCQETGLACMNDLEWSYEITDEAISRTSDAKAKVYLESLKSKPYIFPKNLKQITQHLEEIIPKDAEEIINVLQKTSNRNHLSVTSLSEINGKIWVCIVNKDKQSLKVESFKFLSLIEEKRTLTLHVFPKRYQGNSDDLFELSGSTEGYVLGKFEENNSCLQAVAMKDDEKSIYQRCAFILDPHHLICLYLTLKRIDDDRERFLTLQRDAELNSVPYDPFKELPDIFKETCNV